MSFLLAAMMVAASFVASSPVTATFVDGETLDYNLTWLRITGGTARMTIAVLDDSRFRITSVGKSSPAFSRIYRVHDQIECIVARDDFSTLKYIKRIDERNAQKIEVTTIEDGVATRVRRKVLKVAVPRPVYDPISVIYILRTVDLAVGKTHDMTLVADGKIYNVHARVARREIVQTPAGRFNTVLVEPRMVSGGIEREEKMYIWYTDDARRIPVRIRTEVRFGSITANLQRTNPGVTAIDPPVLRK